jgi:hypothetical protein
MCQSAPAKLQLTTARLAKNCIFDFKFFKSDEEVVKETGVGRDKTIA